MKIFFVQLGNSPDFNSHIFRELWEVWAKKYKDRQPGESKKVAGPTNTQKKFGDFIKTS